MLSHSHLLNRSTPDTDWSLKRNTKLSGYKNRVAFRIGHGTTRTSLGIRPICNATTRHQLIKPVDSAENGLKSDSSLSCFDKSKENIKRMFEKVELSVSSYDTAWVAMVPSPSSPDTPCFPQCLNWLMENQLGDGSWGLHHDSLLVKDALSSTLACVLALSRWGVGEERINKGLQFIKSNFSSSRDEKQHSPVGFDIIFPGMIEYAKDMNLNLDLESPLLDAMLHRRDLEIKRLRSSSKGRKKAYLAYVSEGIGKSQDWETVMKYQKKDGSLFNSPATTAAALIHLKDPPAGCLSYLRDVLKMFGNSVPTIYPFDIHYRLCMVDNLVKLGTDRHFTEEIKVVLDMTYRSWLQKDEDIFSDITTCAMAYRILLLNKYDVSPDPLLHFFKDGSMDIFSGNMDHMHAALEVYKALELVLNIDETETTEKAYQWCRRILRNKLFVSSHTGKFRREVNDAIQFPYYVNFERLRTRRYIEQQFDRDSTRLQKTAYSSPNISNDNFLKLAVEDFNLCQLSQRQELKDLDRWFVENRLDQLETRIKMSHQYFTAAATLFTPDLKDCRIAWTKTAVLVTFIDDLFDGGTASKDEMLNLIELISKWNVNLHADCRSDRVRILFSALQATICDMASTCQQPGNVTKHIVQTWLVYTDSLLQEAMRCINKVMPTMDEYLTSGCISAAMGPILIHCCYVLGVELSEEVFASTEFHEIFTGTSMCVRLLNDIQTHEREIEAGKLNAISLSMINGVITMEKAVEEIKSMNKGYRKQVFRLVYTSPSKEKDPVVVPRACKKDLFWAMCRAVHLYYSTDDGFAADVFVNFEKDMWNEPIVLK